MTIGRIRPIPITAGRWRAQMFSARLPLDRDPEPGGDPTTAAQSDAAAAGTSTGHLSQRARPAAATGSRRSQRAPGPSDPGASSSTALPSSIPSSRRSIAGLLLSKSSAFSPASGPRGPHWASPKKKLTRPRPTTDSAVPGAVAPASFELRAFGRLRQS